MPACWRGLVRPLTPARGRITSHDPSHLRYSEATGVHEAAEIVDVVFSAAEETAAPEAATAEDESADSDERTAPVAFHGACIARIERNFGKRLVRQTRSSYATPDGGFAIVCAVSKTHEIAHPSYWFAFHPYQKIVLESAAEGFLVLGCGSAKTVLAIPAADLFAWLPDMWTTQREDRFYWHIRVHQEGSRFTWDRKGGQGRVDVSRYLLRESTPNDLMEADAGNVRGSTA